VQIWKTNSYPIEEEIQRVMVHLKSYGIHKVHNKYYITFFTCKEKQGVCGHTCGLAIFLHLKIK
jgi:hypothetical protein